MIDTRMIPSGQFHFALDFVPRVHVSRHSIQIGRNFDIDSVCWDFQKFGLRHAKRGGLSLFWYAFSPDKHPEVAKSQLAVVFEQFAVVARHSQVAICSCWIVLLSSQERRWKWQIET